MTPYRFYTLDVFTTRLFGGNPLAVLPDAAGLDPETMQSITREFNLSETVFIFPPEKPANARRLRIFTPATEVPFAGHPTIGAAILLAKIGAVPLAGPETRIVFEEGVGLVPMLIKVTDGQISARLTAAMPPKFGPEPPSAEALAEVISLSAEDIRQDEWFPQAATCGMRFVFIPVRDRQALARARLNLPAWERTLKDFWAPQVFVLCFDPELPGSQIRARMFAPAWGIPEDPATGAAASALGGYLGQRQAQAEGVFSWVMEQGFEMGRPSLLEITAEKIDCAVARVHVGGAAVLVSEGVLNL